MAGTPIIRAILARFIGGVSMVAVTTGALIMNGWLGIVPGSTTTGPPANDRPAKGA